MGRFFDPQLSRWVQVILLAAGAALLAVLVTVLVHVVGCASAQVDRFADDIQAVKLMADRLEASVVKLELGAQQIAAGRDAHVNEPWTGRILAIGAISIPVAIAVTGLGIAVYVLVHRSEWFRARLYRWKGYKPKEERDGRRPREPPGAEGPQGHRDGGT